MVNMFIDNESLILQESNGYCGHGACVDLSQVKTMDIIKVLYSKIVHSVKERLKEWAKYLEILYRI